MCFRFYGFRLVTGQNWTLLCPNIREAKEAFPVRRRAAYPGALLYISAVVEDPPTIEVQACAWDLLARPVEKRRPPNPTRVDTFPDNGISMGAESASLGVFQRLPTELFCLIPEAVPKDDVLSLGQASPTFWNFIVTHIRGVIHRSAARWAGKMLVCCPTPVQNGPEHPTEVIETLEIDTTKALSRKAGEDWERPYYHSADSALDERHWRDFRGVWDVGWQFPMNQPWLLRNLPTRDYVVADTVCPSISDAAPRVSLRHGKINRHCHCIVKVENFLLGQICWAPRAMTENLWVGAISWPPRLLEPRHGVWAGHRFDIVASEMLLTEEGHDDRKNVAEAVAEDFAETLCTCKECGKRKRRAGDVSSHETSKKLRRRFDAFREW